MVRAKLAPSITITITRSITSVTMTRACTHRYTCRGPVVCAVLCVVSTASEPPLAIGCECSLVVLALGSAAIIAVATIAFAAIVAIAVVAIAAVAIAAVAIAVVAIAVVAIAVAAIAA